MKKVETTTNKAAKADGKKHNTRSVAAKEDATTPHVGEQCSQSDKDICECSFCYGENCENERKEWLQVCLWPVGTRAMF